MASSRKVFLVLALLTFSSTTFAQSPHEGKLIKGNGKLSSTVWIVLHGVKHHIYNPTVFNECGFNWNNIQTVPDNVIQGIPEKVRIMSKREYEVVRDNPDYLAIIFQANSSTPGVNSSVTVCKNDGRCATRGAKPNEAPATMASLASQAAAELSLSASATQTRLIVSGTRTRVTCTNCSTQDADTPSVYY